MKNEPAPRAPDHSKTPQERFTELGEKLMRVPRAEAAALEKKWQARKQEKQRRKRMG